MTHAKLQSMIAWADSLPDDTTPDTIASEVLQSPEVDDVPQLQLKRITSAQVAQAWIDVYRWGSVELCKVTPEGSIAHLAISEAIESQAALIASEVIS